MILGHQPLDLAWIAGLFDGEGSVTISYAKHTGKRQDKGFFLVATVSQNRRDVLELLKCRFGGHISPKNPPTHKRCSHWIVTSKAAETFLRYIQPYVKLKQLVVELALEYRSLVGRTRGNKGRKGHSIPPEIKERMFLLRSKVMELNKED